MCALLRPVCTSALSLSCDGGSSKGLPTMTACICSTAVLAKRAAACEPTCCLFQLLLQIVHQAEHSRRELLCGKEACRHWESTVSTPGQRSKWGAYKAGTAGKNMLECVEGAWTHGAHCTQRWSHSYRLPNSLQQAMQGVTGTTPSNIGLAGCERLHM